MKNQKGITLIALIITIIVMLILVAVTLTIALGENGIIAKAREARTKTEGAQTAESELTESIGANKIDNIVSGKSTFETFMSGENDGKNSTYIGKYYLSEDYGSGNLDVDIVTINESTITFYSGPVEKDNNDNYKECSLYYSKKDNEEIAEIITKSDERFVTACNKYGLDIDKFADSVFINIDEGDSHEFTCFNLDYSILYIFWDCDGDYKNPFENGYTETTDSVILDAIANASERSQSS